MTNPNNALGTNAALGGRTSVDAFNDAISSLTRGVVSGFAVTPSSAMTLNVGGTAGVRDVAVAVSPNGNRVSVDNRTTSPIKVTMAAASASSARIDAIVAYVNSPSQVTATTPDNPTACGIIPVSGTTSAQPTDSAIRTAISTDGGTGSTAYYAIIAIVKLAANTTTITSNMITMQKSRIADSLVTNNSIADKTIKSDKVDWTTLSGDEWPLINATTSNNNINNKEDYTQYSFAVPVSGRYFVSFTQQLGSNAANGYGLTLKIKLGGTTICQSGAAITGNAAYMYGNVSCVVSANAGQVITCTTTGGSTDSASTANGRVSLARIA